VPQNPSALLPRRILSEDEVLNKAEKLILKPGSFEIVLPRRATYVAKYAAKHLSEVPGKMLNCKVPVVTKGTGKAALHVGEYELAAKMKLDMKALDRDGFHINPARHLGIDDRGAPSKSARMPPLWSATDVSLKAPPRSAWSSSTENRPSEKTKIKRDEEPENALHPFFCVWKTDHLISVRLTSSSRTLPSASLK
jgi:hypothetical protein